MRDSKRITRCVAQARVKRPVTDESQLLPGADRGEAAEGEVAEVLPVADSRKDGYGIVLLATFDCELSAPLALYALTAKYQVAEAS